MTDRRHVIEEDLPEDLELAVGMLRETEEASALWRRRVVAAVERDADQSRRWSIRPWVAVAAAVVCLLAGAAGATLIRPSSVLNQPTVRFALRAPAASKVSLVGDFNGWNPTTLPMHRDAGGQFWIVDVPLPAGRYGYAYVVDGTLASDPTAPKASDDFGTANSVILVKGS